MIADTSAIVAILHDEDDAARYARAIANATSRRLSAASYLECGIVLGSQRDPVISRVLDEFRDETGFVVESASSDKLASPGRPTRTSERAATIRLV